MGKATSLKPLPSKKSKPRVGIVTGSIPDFEAGKIHKAIEILSDAGVEVTYDVVSAHRSPEQLLTYSERAKDAGVEVIIAAAGGAAHLPGMLTSFAYPLKVIGLPILTSSDTFGGLGALLANVQMPPGASLSSVGVNAVENAADEALKVLAIKYPAIYKYLEAKQVKGNKEAVADIHKSLESTGKASYRGKQYNVAAYTAYKLMTSKDF